MANWDPVYLNRVYCFIWIFLIVVTAAAIAARIYVRIYLRGLLFNLRSWHWSDILLVISWAGYTTSGIMKSVVILTYGFVDSNIDSKQDQPHWLVSKKIIYHYVTVFWVFVFVIKGAMLCFFNEFISKTYIRLWVFIRVLGVLVFVGGLSSFIYQLLWCLPMDRQWATGERYCWGDTDKRFRFTLYRQGWHVILDLIILCIPLPLFPLLKAISMRQKVGLVIMLLLGLFCVVSAITFTIGVLNWDNGSLSTGEAQWFLQYEPIVEMAAAILLQCIPALRFLFTIRQRRDSTLPLSVIEMRSGGSRSSKFGSKLRSKLGSSISSPMSSKMRSVSEAETGGFTTLKGGYKDNLVTIETEQETPAVRARRQRTEEDMYYSIGTL